MHKTGGLTSVGFFFAFPSISRPVLFSVVSTFRKDSYYCKSNFYPKQHDQEFPANYHVPKLFSYAFGMR